MLGDQTSTASSEAAAPALATLYERFLLDPLVEVARCVAFDVIKRPRLYRALPEHLATLLEGFRISTGSAPEWPSAMQRAVAFCGIFEEAFTAAAIVLRSSAVSNVERVGPEASRFAVQSVRDAIASFRAYLAGLQGAVVDETERRTATVFNRATEILRSEVVGRVFGFERRPEGHAGIADPALIAEIQRSLGLLHLRPALGPHRLILLQQAGKHGAATIAAVLNQRAGSDSEDIEALIANAYAWEKAIQALVLTSDPIRAWKDPAYRERLTPCEREKMAHHPSGEINLKSTPLDSARAMIGLGGGWGEQCTWVFAVCCSTAGGDPCTQASQGSDYCCGTNVGFTCPVDSCGQGTYAFTPCGGVRL
jgi:mersacidin/lichenicidin family type 2 lantibiotic